MPELGSATVQVWAKREAERRARREAEADRIFGRLDAQLEALSPPKPWLRDWIRGLWKRERVLEKFR